MIQEDFLYILAQSIHLLPFEGRKDCQSIFSHVLRFRPPNSTAEDSPALDYVINDRPEIIIELCRSYEHKESVMPSGVVLREILRHEDVAQLILCDQSKPGEAALVINEINEDVPQTGDGVFWKFFPCIDTGAFEVSADAFSTFRVGNLRNSDQSMLTCGRTFSRNTKRLSRNTLLSTLISSLNGTIRR